ncbi:hypothetical protein DFJ73DRAFT_780971 [Zopfochytrium polystomum]|nr:hypothetical protein DFJ73DRAFT_780971 [Zopfochytrium polystomum]
MFRSLVATAAAVAFTVLTTFPAAAQPAPPIVPGFFTIQLTNLPASSEYCVGDAIAFTLSLVQVPATNPANASDPTLIYFEIIGPQQDPFTDPTGISKGFRGLALPVSDPAPVVSFATAASVAVPDVVAGFTALALRAVLAFQSTIDQPSFRQAVAVAAGVFSIAKVCVRDGGGGGGGGGSSGSVSVSASAFGSASASASAFGSGSGGATSGAASTTVGATTLSTAVTSSPGAVGTSSSVSNMKSNALMLSSPLRAAASCIVSVVAVWAVAWV